MPASTKISKAHWNAILGRIHDGYCVPFLGAGVNLSGGAYTKGLPLGGQVASRLLDEFVEDGDLDAIRNHPKLELSDAYRDLASAAHQNLARVALHYERHLQEDYQQFLSTLMQAIPDAACQPSPLLHALAGMPLRLIITTNYDRLMERALQARHKPFVPITQRIDGFNPQEIQEHKKRLSETDDLVVYKIHGTFPEVAAGAVPEQDDAHRIIVTERDYIRFLITIGGGDTPLESAIPALVLGKLADSTILFLGYSMEDWDVRAIFDGVVARLPGWRWDQRISFAVQKDPSDFWVEYWKTRKVIIYNINIHDFAEQLREKYEEKYGSLDA